MMMAGIMITSQSQAQSKADFERRMTLQIEKKLADATTMKQATELYSHSCEKDHITTADEIKARAAEAEKHRFIQENMAEYMELYFPLQASPLTDPTICDNGGFEDDFLYYNGYVSQYTSGSITCTPVLSYNWIPVTLPVSNRFEIMTAGVDPLIGIQKVKFGNKSLRINNKYGHNNLCVPQGGIDRMTKTFVVTEENRNFTVWYAVALENPSYNHQNQQPFLNIKCDKAPADELCFDADFLMCEQDYSDPNCTFVDIDVLDWACHKFHIPASEVGNIATVEMVVGDCGQTEHFGYAYIDGFCEPCTGSSLGTIDLYQSDYTPLTGIGINYYSCDGMSAQICGTFTLPTLCGNWSVDKIQIPGYTINNLSIDNNTHTFCFDFPISNFGTQNCIDIQAEITFISGGVSPPSQYSDFISVCKDKYGYYDYSVVVGGCHDNGTTDVLSDDYYYVEVEIDDPGNIGWTLQRQLEDPYPGESGLYTIGSGSGTSTLLLGPYLIQEGCWDLLINFPNCNFSEKICPPDFCSGCNAFAGLEISNVQCIPGPPDTWSYDIYVPGTGLYTLNGSIKSKGTTYTISAGNIGESCVEFELKMTINNIDCKHNIIVCPPVPCSVSNCNIEVYPGKVYSCDSDFTMGLHINNPNNLSLWYKIAGSSSGSPLPSSGVVGPFTGDVQLVIYDSNNPACYKVIYLPLPDCGDKDLENVFGRKKSSNDGNVLVYPNPFIDAITIKSKLPLTQFTLYDISGKMVESGMFFTSEKTLYLDHASGVYVLQYMDADGKVNSIKVVKL